MYSNIDKANILINITSHIATIKENQELFFFINFYLLNISVRFIVVEKLNSGKFHFIAVLYFHEGVILNISLRYGDIFIGSFHASFISLFG